MGEVGCWGSMLVKGVDETEGGGQKAGKRESDWRVRKPADLVSEDDMGRSQALGWQRCTLNR